MDDAGQTPAPRRGKQAAEILIKEGAKVTPKDRKGKTPLDYAEASPMIKLLKDTEE